MTTIVKYTVQVAFEGLTPDTDVLPIQRAVQAWIQIQSSIDTLRIASYYLNHGPNIMQNNKAFELQASLAWS